MNKNFIKVALLAVLGTLAVSCQKENTLIEEATIVAENGAIYRVSYTIDGVTHQVTLFGDDAWHNFLHSMIALAEEGHKVSFRNENASSQIASSKEVVVYTTSSHDAAYEWADKMVNLGYFVTVEYDPRTGKYTCTAIK